MTDSTKSGSFDSAFDTYRSKRREPVELRPTYPLDIKQIQSLREDVVLDSPKFLVWQLLAQLGSRFTMLSRFSESWAEIEPQLNSAVVEHVVKQSNVAQDQVIRCLIDVLRNNGENLYADTLLKFLISKQTIELALQMNRSLASQRADVETIVDSIMQEVCNEIFVLVEMETDVVKMKTRRGLYRQNGTPHAEIQHLEGTIDEAKDRIARAYETIMETERQTTYRQEMTHASSLPPESVVLDKLIDALREENDFAQTVNERIGVELPRSE